MQVRPTRILNKVLAAVIGAGIGPAVVGILVWLLSLAGVPVPDYVQTYFNGIMSAILAGVSAYYTQIAPGEMMLVGEQPPVEVSSPVVNVTETQD
jgi:hypothetical protein